MRRIMSLRACAASSRDKVTAAFLTGRLSKMCTGTRVIKYLSTFPNFTLKKGAQQTKRAKSRVPNIWLESVVLLYRYTLFLRLK
jgi:hypothetical protein